MSKLTKTSFQEEILLTAIEADLIAMEDQDEVVDSTVYEAGITDCYTVIGSLEEFSDTVETMISSGNITQQALTTVTDRLIQLSDESGIAMDITPIAMEDFSDESLVPATEALMDKIKAAAKTTWRVILELIKKIIAAAKLFINNVIASGVIIKASLAKLKPAYINIKEDIKTILKTDIEVSSSIATALGLVEGGTFNEKTYATLLDRKVQLLGTLIYTDIVSKFQEDMITTLESISKCDVFQQMLDLPFIQKGMDESMIKYLSNIPTLKKYHGYTGDADNTTDLVLDNFTIKVTRHSGDGNGNPTWMISTNMIASTDTEGDKTITVKRSDKASIINAIGTSDYNLGKKALFSKNFNSALDLIYSKTDEVNKLVNKIDNTESMVLSGDVSDLISNILRSYNSLLTLHISVNRYLISEINKDTKALYNFAVLNYRKIKDPSSKDD